MNLIRISKNDKKFFGIDPKDFENYKKYWLGEMRLGSDHIYLEINTNLNDIFLILDKHKIDLGKHLEARNLKRYMNFYKVLYDQKIFWLNFDNYYDSIEII